ncbi:hypothetical protein [Salinibacterium sp. ZJ454]|uniref:hypothetical protein n=1 Tax=Salinibacterium sp. ZJ454 TaxID=2708339 RepID=UPI00141E377D|nr:hypothetical protein [Salinibacterium sp. ZJ454]
MDAETVADEIAADEAKTVWKPSPVVRLFLQAVGIGAFLGALVPVVPLALQSVQLLLSEADAAVWGPGLFFALYAAMIGAMVGAAVGLGAAVAAFAAIRFGDRDRDWSIGRQALVGGVAAFGMCALVTVAATFTVTLSYGSSLSPLPLIVGAVAGGIAAALIARTLRRIEH